MVIKQYDEMGEEKEIEFKDSDFNPEKNPDVIVILKRKDGNYMGFTQKNGKMAEAREIKPEDVLVRLLTNE